MSSKKSPKVLIIVDGFGYSDSGKYNAISAANAPYWRNLWENNPKTLISTSGMAVGLPEGQMGNSEVGHMTLGAGRVVYQNFTRINKAISDGDFFTNPVYCDAIDKAQSTGNAVHIMGLLSPGGVHSHEDHINAMLEMAAQRGAEKIYLHAFLDGRDCPPRSAQPSLEKTQALIEKLGVGKIASICGRFFALDRDNRWDRVEEAYNLVTSGRADFSATDAVSALNDAYARDENDEFVHATTICGEGEAPVTLEDGDALTLDETKFGDTTEGKKRAVAQKAKAARKERKGERRGRAVANTERPASKGAGKGPSKGPSKARGEGRSDARSPGKPARAPARGSARAPARGKPSGPARPKKT